jgi:bifunctional non-homologous end joining protein LigD
MVNGALHAYQAKRNFAVTTEPSGAHVLKKPPQHGAAATELSFVIQKHWASSLHYDFRLELGGTMKSWAVPKGPSLDSKDKRLAVQVEDHPIAYSSFDGSIPAGQYGAGRVIIWDKGTWTPMVDDPQKAYLAGNLKFTLHGHKLGGNWALVRMAGDRNGSKQPPWLLIKEKDAFARPSAEFNVVEALPESVAKTTAKAKSVAGMKPAHAAAPVVASVAVSKARRVAKLAPTPATPLPLELKPQLATLVDRAPDDAAQWIYEIKYDGYRMLTRVEGEAVQLFTRTGKDWSSKLPTLLNELKRLRLPTGWYDGEIVVLDPQTGHPDFGALQESMDSARSADVVLYLFDLLFCDGKDLRQQPLHARRALLEKTLEAAPASSQVRFSQAFDVDTDSLIASACKLGLEGIMGKRKDSMYVSRRSPDWIKLKCHQRQEFVIGGYTEPQGTRKVLGALLLGVFDAAGDLQYTGKVGTGFDAKTLQAIAGKLKPHGSHSPAFVNTADIEGHPHWVKPVLVAEVAFQEWTQTGRIRQAVFHGLRTDKDARSILREMPVAQPRGVPARKTATIASRSTPARAAPNITHAERVIDTQSGLTKGDLVNYYQQVADLITVHLHDRPTAVMRAPDGVGGDLFFQKHLGAGTWPGIDAMPTDGETPANAMLQIRGAQGVLSAAQWNVVEFHTANASKRALLLPDRMVFDLDPGEGVQWVQIQEAAALVRAFLAQLELPSFLKTTGGKGLHVVVPLRRAHGWATVKGLSQAIVQHMSAQIPQRFVAKSGPRNRVGKIFIDYLRNGEGATTVSAWSARARAGMGISVPVAWDELDDLRGGDHWTVHTFAQRLSIGNAPWDAYAKSARSLTTAMKKLGYKPDA